jgi:hypothetical protein
MSELIRRHETQVTAFVLNSLRFGPCNVKPDSLVALRKRVIHEH